MTKETDAYNWLLKGRCYKLGHDVPHPGCGTSWPSL